MFLRGPNQSRISPDILGYTEKNGERCGFRGVSHLGGLDLRNVHNGSKPALLLRPPGRAHNLCSYVC